MKIFCVVFLVFVVSLGLFLFRSPVRKPEPEAAREYFVETPYRSGYRRGYESFLEQMGEEVRLPRVRYVSNTGHEVSSEDELRGYVDGYHRAAASVHCPR